MIRYIFSCFAFIMMVSCKPNKADALKLQPDWYNVAFLITDGVYNTELTAPFDVFHHTRFRKGIRALNVFTVSNRSDYVTTFEGLKIQPDYNFLVGEVPKIDILVIPSAAHHLDTDLENKDLLAWVKKTSENATWVTSHCDGAFLLAKTGLLNGHRATTFPADLPKFKAMFPDLTAIDSVYFVHDGKFITSEGGARSFDAALYLTQELYGDSIARSIADGLVIDWDLGQIPFLKLNPTQ